MLVMTLLNRISFSMFVKNLPKWIALGFSYSIISSFIDIMFFIRIFRIEKEKSKLLVILCLFSVSRFILYLIIPQPLYKILDLILVFAIFKIGIKQTLEKSILGAVFNCVMVQIIEIALRGILIIAYIDIQNYTQGILNFEYSLMLKSLTITIRVIILALLYKKNFHISFSDHLQPKNKRSIILDAILGVSIIMVTEIGLLNGIKNFPYLLFALNIVLYLSMCFRNILRINDLEVQALKIHTLEVYNKTLSLMYDNIRGFKHDFSNFVLALDGYVETENINGIRKMSKSILNDCISVCKMEILDPKIINDPAIYSILTSKYYLAKEQNLNMNIEILSKIDNDENSYEICRILGILLDNAIEAAKDSKDKILNIRFMTDTKIKRDLIIIENSYENKNVDVNKIFEKGYTSKENPSREHGLGLWNIRNILMNNENLNLYTTANDLFRQQLEIY